jgi:gas vesicle protein
MAADRGSGFFAGLIIGAVAGGALALLLAQDDVRDLIVGKAREAGNVARDAGEDVREKVGGIASRWQSELSELYRKGKDVLDQARGTVTASVEEARAEIDRLKEELRRAADA